MNRNVLFGIALFVVVFMCYVNYSTADYQLASAIQSLTGSVDTLNSNVRRLKSEVDTLNSRINTLNSKIGTRTRTGTLICAIDDLETDVVNLRNSIRRLR